LHVHFRDVYLVGRPKPEPYGLALAAVLHLRGRAIVNGRTAAGLWGITDPHTHEPPSLLAVGIDVRSRPGLKLRRTAGLDPVDVRRRHGLPVTSPARTIVDLAGELPLPELENAFANATQARLTTSAAIAATLRRAGHPRGAARLRRLLTDTAPAVTRSHWERRLLSLIRAAHLPAPIANAPVASGYAADLLWPDHRLIVEFDGWATHSSRRAFEHDRKRDQALAAAGYLVIRVTARQLETEPFAVIARIAAALIRRQAA
jgi:very-short-patch-repair endonuclease